MSQTISPGEVNKNKSRLDWAGSLHKVTFVTLRALFFENFFVFLGIFLLTTKIVGFNYLNGFLDPFPYTLRPILVGFIINLAIFAPAFLLKKKHKFIYTIVLNTLFSLVIIFDLSYIRYFSALPSVGLLDHFGQAFTQIPEIQHLFELSDLFFLADIVFLVIFYRNIGKRLKSLKWHFKTTKIEKFVSRVAFTGAFLILVLGFGTDFVLNGFFGAAVNNVIDNKIAAENYGLIGAHLFDVYRNVEQNFRHLSATQRQAVINQVNDLKYKQTDNVLTGQFAGKNIIMVQVESLQAFVVNKKVEGQEITPNLNKLYGQSHYFENNYFEVGGGGTSDADFSSNTSLFPMQLESAFVKFGRSDFTSLPKELKKVGYGTVAYHGYTKSFWNREQAFNSLGYDKFISSESYTGSKIGLGLDDGDFLTQSENFIKSQPKPFFSYLITLSSHTPFELDDKYQSLKLSAGKYPEITADYMESIHYTDEQLGKFIDKLKADGLYDDSVIVLYGDHPAGVYPVNYGGINFDPDKIYDKKIPLFIKLPGQNNNIIYNDVSSNMDIMPTLLNLVGEKTNSPMFGRDLFSNAKPFFSPVDRMFSNNTVFSGDTRYYEPDSNTQLCEKRNSKGNYAKVDTSNCSNLVSQELNLKSLSDQLIRYNLFKYFK